jgi:DNA-binding transcriptional regulator GbsR (MarR family)
MKQISISDIQRNLHKLEEFDIVEIIDKKRDMVKGYFLDQKYLFFVRELIEKKKDDLEHHDRLAGSLHQYADEKQRMKESDAWQKHIMEKYKS